MDQFPSDIYSEPRDYDLNTLARLGPLAPLAGVWQGSRGVDTKPKADGPRQQDYVEYYELQPIDPVTNGPQLLYGLRYRIHITKPGQVKTYHEQVGYWLWEPATGTVIHTLTIPRGQTVLALGQATAESRQFSLRAGPDVPGSGIAAIPFLEHAFRTSEFRIDVTINADGSWAYEEDTVLQIQGQDAPFHHTDRNLLVRMEAATPNPLVR
ncbi:MAG: hypothetical protein RIR00_1315 [Pseudomonadota bacterium]|jgi:hypothetical protein